MTADKIAWLDVGRCLAAQLAWFQAALLAAAALTKVGRWRHTLDVARRFARVPANVAGAASVGVVAFELAAAAALIFAPLRAAGAGMAVLLWSVYLVLLLRAIGSNRRDIDCGCSFGAAAAAGHRPIGAFQVARNVVLVVLAAMVAAGSVQAGSDAPVSQALAALALLALYAALDQVMSLRPLRSGEVV